MEKLEIDRLRATQMTHGERQIRQKSAMYKTLKGHDLEIAIAEKPVPVVFGPDGAPYAIDHHHVATALWRAEIRTVPFVLVSDLSSLTLAEFWLTLENSGWTYPYDPDGRRASFAQMPTHVWEAADDEFRSLAAAVRDAGGYEKTDVPLEEFRWANLFRATFARPDSDEQFEALVDKAVKLARSPTALGLPGYVGPQEWAAADCGQTPSDGSSSG
ncbi:ParB/Srx family N-terminal domain-containing protein [Paraburkholderia sp. LEh10]|uniref:ParB-like protein n=1 Tax=Paraburkholderia sp. LEh10 TaxID=2821353 RepID=UPI001AE69BB9|nr:ParB/Srx family N-terminal domain-containing protein [Paraburkholderia sp. LEh10]MBP0588546.1 ParB/Srx family N-terminal domain-containing protein [Paraburkholderia sp. LEh10]